MAGFIKKRRKVTSYGGLLILRHFNKCPYGEKTAPTGFDVYVGSSSCRECRFFESNHDKSIKCKKKKKKNKYVKHYPSMVTNTIGAK